MPNSPDDSAGTHETHELTLPEPTPAPSGSATPEPDPPISDEERQARQDRFGVRRRPAGPTETRDVSDEPSPDVPETDVIPTGEARP